MANGFLKIGDKELEARSSGLTAEIYRNVFNDDIEQRMSDIKAKKISNSEALLLYKRLAFVMCWQALPRDCRIGDAIKKLSEIDFYEWLDKFESLDVLNEELIKQVTALWLKNTQSLVEIKNK